MNKLTSILTMVLISITSYADINSSNKCLIPIASIDLKPDGVTKVIDRLETEFQNNWENQFKQNIINQNYALIKQDDGSSSFNSEAMTTEIIYESVHGRFNIQLEEEASLLANKKLLLSSDSFFVKDFDIQDIDVQSIDANKNQYQICISSHWLLESSLNLKSEEMEIFDAKKMSILIGKEAPFVACVQLNINGEKTSVQPIKKNNKLSDLSLKDIQVDAISEADYPFYKASLEKIMKEKSMVRTDAIKALLTTPTSEFYRFKSELDYKRFNIGRKHLTSGEHPLFESMFKDTIEPLIAENMATIINEKIKIMLNLSWGTDTENKLDEVEKYFNEFNARDYIHIKHDVPFLRSVNEEVKSAGLDKKKISKIIKKHKKSFKNLFKSIHDNSTSNELLTELELLQNNSLVKLKDLDKKAEIIKINLQNKKLTPKNKTDNHFVVTTNALSETSNILNKGIQGIGYHYGKCVETPVFSKTECPNDVQISMNLDMLNHTIHEMVKKHKLDFCMSGRCCKFSQKEDEAPMFTSTGNNLKFSIPKVSCGTGNKFANIIIHKFHAKAALNITPITLADGSLKFDADLERDFSSSGLPVFKQAITTIIEGILVPKKLFKLAAPPVLKNYFDGQSNKDKKGFKIKGLRFGRPLVRVDNNHLNLCMDLAPDEVTSEDLTNPKSFFPEGAFK